jgi:hypothetical protein
MTQFIAQAVSANVTFAKSQVALIDATAKADDRFTASARAFQRALDSGASTREVAGAVKEATADVDTRLVPFLYTSPTSVTFHALTSLVIDLDGGVMVKDEVLLGFQIQTVVKNAIKALGTKTARELIESAETAQKAFDALERATRISAEEATEEATAESDGEESEITEGDLDKVEQYLLLAIDQLTNAQRALSDGATLSDASKGALASIEALVVGFAVKA